MTDFIMGDETDANAAFDASAQDIAQNDNFSDTPSMTTRRNENTKLTEEEIAAAEARNIAAGVAELKSNGQMVETAAVKEARNSISRKYMR